MASEYILILDYLNEYIFKVTPIKLLELLAAIAGTYFLRKKPKTLFVNKYLVYFLWYTFINEVIASYAGIAYFSNYEYFGFIKETVFFKNVWLYNIYNLINFSFLTYYFGSYLQNKNSFKIYKFIIPFYLLISVFTIFYTGSFFKLDSLFSILVGSIILLISIIQFYFDLLKSEQILILKKYLPVYISIGVLVFNICIPPFFIFSHYFNSENSTFVLLRTNVLLIANIFMYSTFIVGFIVCAKNEEETVI